MKKKTFSSDFLEKLKISPGQKKYIYTLLAVSMIGILSIVLGSQLSKDHQTVPRGTGAESQKVAANEPEGQPSNLEGDEKRLAAEVAEILNEVQGVGQVLVKVTLLSTTEAEYAIDRQSNQTKTNESLQNGGTRTTDETRADEKMVMKSQPQGENAPVLIKESRPQVLGVIVVADGAGDLLVKEQITQAVQVLLGIPSHKITVLPKERGTTT